MTNSSKERCVHFRAKKLFAVAVLMTYWSNAWCSQASEWLVQAAKVPRKGATEWTVVLTTGHFGRDPRLAQATREFVVETLFEAGSDKDFIRVVATEMKTWNISATVPLNRIRELLPVAPAPGSKGGHDIEATLAQLAPTAKGPILVFSPSASQLPIGGEGVLMGGDGSVEGFLNPQRSEFDVSTVHGPRSIHLTLLTREELFRGDARRIPVQVPNVKTANSKFQVSGNAGISNSIWATLCVGLACLGVGFFVGKRKAIGSPNGDGELEAWRKESKVQHRKIDLIAQELAEASSQISADKEEASIALRQEIARYERALKTWDQTAMDFLDGIDRALEHPELSAERRQTWERAFTQFSKLAQRAGLDLISPSVGDPIIDGQHKIEKVVPSTPQASEGTVSELIAPGYRRGELVLRQAKICMAGEDK